MGVTTVFSMLSFNTFLTYSVQIISLEPRPRFRHQPLECQKESVISCKYVSLDTAAPKWADEITLPNNSTMKIKSRTESSAIYKDSLMEAYFSWNKGAMVVKISQPGRVWTIHGCGDAGCFLMIEHYPHKQYEGDGVELPSGLKQRSKIPTNGVELPSRLIQAPTIEDSGTKTTISNIVYYTTKFKNSFTNEEAMNAFINLVFLETNQGYENSDIPIILVLHCKLELITDTDYESMQPSNALITFTDTESRKSADTASLWTAYLYMTHSQSCAAGWVDVARTCPAAYVVVDKNCALLGYKFAHELGHNLGNRHNI